MLFPQLIFKVRRYLAINNSLQLELVVAFPPLVANKTAFHYQSHLRVNEMQLEKLRILLKVKSLTNVQI